jgi:hypothetical protein
LHSQTLIKLGRQDSTFDKSTTLFFETTALEVALAFDELEPDTAVTQASNDKYNELSNGNIFNGNNQNKNNGD